ncbi:MAG: hypothetical protein HQK84_10680, partial [Nitrospinae bacterium]|nr:hypothetical protein [Nitrospinota bacterium]
MPIYSEKVKKTFFISSISVLCFFSSIVYTRYVEQQFRLPKELFFQFISFSSALVFVLYTLYQENSLSAFLNKNDLKKKELRPILLLLTLFTLTVLTSSLFSSQTYFSTLYLISFFSGLLLFYLMFFLRLD